MLGDVNMFFEDDLGSDTDEQTQPSEAESAKEAMSRKVVGELNIMIANPNRRGHGCGKLVLATFIWFVSAYQECLMHEYTTDNALSEPQCTKLQCNQTHSGKVKLTELVAKIDKENEKSIKLFGHLGFKKVRDEPNYFGEVEMRAPLETAVKYAEDIITDKPSCLPYSK